MGFFNTIVGNVSNTDLSAIGKKYELLLCEGEFIECAFTHMRDKWVFTNKRIIIQDTKGITGRRKQYVSIPYRSVEYYSIETAGTLDTAAMLKISVRGINELVKVKFGRGKDLEIIQKVLAQYSL